MDVRPLILYVNQDGVEVFINGEIYPIHSSTVGEAAIDAWIALGDDERMLLQGEYEAGVITGKVQRGAGFKGSFQVERLRMPWELEEAGNG